MDRNNVVVPLCLPAQGLNAGHFFREVFLDLRPKVANDGPARGPRMLGRNSTAMRQAKMTPTQLIAPLARGCLALLLLGLPACETIKEKAGEADRELQAFFGTDQTAAAAPAAPQEVETEEIYQAAVKAGETGDEVSTIETLKRAAAAGDGRAAYELAQAYTHGIGVERNLDEAARWLNRAADLKEPRALYLIGVNYATGAGVPPDPEKAAYYYGEAAVRGHALAQYELAEAFANGKGAPKNIAWAMRWYGRAAYQGLADAQFAYGVLIATGRGLPKDPRLAYRWLRLAELQNHPEAGAPREAVERQLSPEIVARETDWIALFRPESTTGLNDVPTVKYLQYQLAEIGYPAGPVDGLMGPKTAAAIAAYKRDRGLSASGDITDDLLARVLEESLKQQG